MGLQELPDAAHRRNGIPAGRETRLRREAVKVTVAALAQLAEVKEGVYRRYESGLEVIGEKTWERVDRQLSIQEEAWRGIDPETAQAQKRKFFGWGVEMLEVEQLLFEDKDLQSLLETHLEAALTPQQKRRVEEIMRERQRRAA